MANPLENDTVAKILDSILDAIGNTPLVRLRTIGRQTGCEILCKCEYLNAGGSVKDRIGKRMLEEVRVSGNHSDRLNLSDIAGIGLDEREVPILSRSGVENAEPIFAPSDHHFRLNLAVDDPFIGAARRIDHFIAAIRVEIAESLIGKNQRKVGDTVVSRQLQRAIARVFMAWIGGVIDDVHSVHAQEVIIERELCAVVVEPERAHLFPWITNPVKTRVSAKRVDTGIDIWVKMVFVEITLEKVASETIAL